MLKIKEIPVEKIKVGKHALRMGQDDEGISDLAVSIGRVGVIVPLVVVPDADVFVLVAGHRRFAAAGRAGLAAVPCIIRQSGAAEVKELSFAENMFRQDLSAVETAAGIKDVLDQGIMDVPGIAAAMHRSEHWVSRQVDLLNWPDDVLGVVHSGRLSVSAASNLALVDDDVYRAFLLRNAIEGGATARVTAAWLQAYRSMAPPESAVQAEPVAAGERIVPMVPQAPCLACGDVYRTDELSHVPICQRCIRAIRNVGGS